MRVALNSFCVPQVDYASEGLPASKLLASCVETIEQARQIAHKVSGLRRASAAGLMNA
jgi:hypothetical protein